MYVSACVCVEKSSLIDTYKFKCQGCMFDVQRQREREIEREREREKPISRAT